jgi:hypothetical protein
MRKESNKREVTEDDLVSWHARNQEFKEEYARKQMEIRDKCRRKDNRKFAFTPEIEIEILNRLEQGQTLPMMEEEPNMPSASLIYKWMRDYPDFGKRVREARANGAHHLAAQILDIAREVPNVIIDNQGNFSFDAAYISWQKIRMEAHKWLASKYLPKDYGDRKPHEKEVKSKDGGSRSDYERMMEIVSNLEMSKRVEKITKVKKVTRKKQE